MERERLPVAHDRVARRSARPGSGRRRPSPGRGGRRSSPCPRRPTGRRRSRWPASEPELTSTGGCGGAKKLSTERGFCAQGLWVFAGRVVGPSANNVLACIGTCVPVDTRQGESTATSDVRPRPHRVASDGDERSPDRGRPGPAGTPAEPRRRGVGPRRDDALAVGDRRGERGALAGRARVLPGEPREDLPGCARALREGRAGRRDHARRRAGRARRAGGRRRQGPGPRAGGARPGERQRRPLRADRQGDGDAARAHPRRRRDRAARLGAARRDHGAGRPGRADPLRPLPGEGDLGVQPHRDAPEGELRAHHAALRVGRGRHGRAVGLPGPRPDHLRLPGREPRRHRRPPEHGQVGARPRRGGQPRRAQERPGRALHARDVEVGGDPAADVQRGEGRVAAAADRQALGRRLAAPDRGLRQARQGADLRRRHRLDHDDGDPLEGAAG